MSSETPFYLNNHFRENHKTYRTYWIRFENKIHFVACDLQCNNWNLFRLFPKYKMKLIIWRTRLKCLHTCPFPILIPFHWKRYSSKIHFLYHHRQVYYSEIYFDLPGTIKEKFAHTKLKGSMKKISLLKNTEIGMNVSSENQLVHTPLSSKNKKKEKNFKQNHTCNMRHHRNNMKLWRILFIFNELKQFQKVSPKWEFNE